MLALGFYCMITATTINATQFVHKKNRSLVVYSQCTSGEATSDILASVDGIKASLTKKGIKLKIDNKKLICGYLLVNGAKTRKISGALTDIELQEEIDRFFK